MNNTYILDQGGVIGCGFCRYDITTAEIDNLKVKNRKVKSIKITYRLNPKILNIKCYQKRIKYSIIIFYKSKCTNIFIITYLLLYKFDFKPLYLNKHCFYWSIHIYNKALYNVHETAEHLLCIIVYSRIRKADARAVKCHPCAPLQLKIGKEKYKS